MKLILFFTVALAAYRTVPLWPAMPATPAIPQQVYTAASTSGGRHCGRALGLVEAGGTTVRARHPGPIAALPVPVRPVLTLRTALAAPSALAALAALSALAALTARTVRTPTSAPEALGGAHGVRAEPPPLFTIARACRRCWWLCSAPVSSARRPHPLRSPGLTQQPPRRCAAGGPPPRPLLPPAPPPARALRSGAQSARTVDPAGCQCVARSRAQRCSADCGGMELTRTNGRV